MHVFNKQEPHIITGDEVAWHRMRVQGKRCLRWMGLIAVVWFGTWLFSSLADQDVKTSLNDIQDGRGNAEPKESNKQQPDNKRQPEDSAKTSFLNPQMRDLSSDWQVVKEHELYVYSAYHDGRQNSVVVISIVGMHAVRNLENGTCKCALWYDDKPHHPQLTDVDLAVLEGHQNR